MVIHDDFWEASQYIPTEQRTGFFHALIAYGMAGVEPSPKEPWYALFIAFRGRIDMSVRNSANGSKGGRPRKNEQPADAEPEPVEKPQEKGVLKPSAKPVFKPTDDGVSKHKEKEIDKEEKERKVQKKESPPQGVLTGFDEFRLGALAIWNEETGQLIGNLPQRAVMGLRRAYDSGRTLDDVRQVVRKKHAEWKDDARMSKFVRPSTVFGDKFDEYLNQKEAVESGPDEFDEFADL